MTSRRDRKCMVKPKSYFMKYKSKTKGNFIYLTAGDSGRLSFITLFKCCNLYHVHPAALNVDINWNKYDFFLRLLRRLFQSRSVSSAAQMNINPENNENQVMERGNQQSTSNEQASMSRSTVRSTEKQRESGSYDGDNYQYDLPCPDGIM